MKKLLYLGTDPSHCPLKGEFVHYPVIRIVPRDREDPLILKAITSCDTFTHIIFTSKNGVNLFFDLFAKTSLDKKTILSVGQVTTHALHENGVSFAKTASNECQEGIIEMIEGMSSASFLLPCSSRTRSLLRGYLTKRNLPFLFCPLYDTEPNITAPLPHLEAFDAIVFTSPSCVEAFFHAVTFLPNHLELIAQGLVTKKMVAKLYNKRVELMFH